MGDESSEDSGNESEHADKKTVKIQENGKKSGTSNNKTNENSSDDEPESKRAKLDASGDGKKDESSSSESDSSSDDESDQKPVHKTPKSSKPSFQIDTTPQASKAEDAQADEHNSTPFNKNVRGNNFNSSRGAMSNERGRGNDRVCYNPSTGRGG